MLISQKSSNPVIPTASCSFFPSSSSSLPPPLSPQITITIVMLILITAMHWAVGIVLGTLCIACNPHDVAFYACKY